MRIFRNVIVALFVVSLVLSSFLVACTDNGSTDNGDGNGNTTVNGNTDNENGDEDETPITNGEIVGMWKYTTTWVTDPGTGTPYSTQTFSGFTPLIEDGEGKLFLLSAPLNSHFEYDGGALAEVTITIAGYTYSHYAPFDYEYIDMGVGEKQITYTGIQVTVTGAINTVATDSFIGDEIHVETIEEYL